MSKAYLFYVAQRLAEMVMKDTHANKWIDKKVITRAGQFQRLFPESVQVLCEIGSCSFVFDSL